MKITSVMIIFTLIVSSIFMAGFSSGSHAIAGMNDFYSSVGEQHDTEIAGGNLHLRPINHFYIDALSDDRIVDVSYDYYQDAGYYLTDSGNIYKVDNGEVTLVKALGPTGNALAVRNGIIAAATVTSGSTPESSVYVYHDGDWHSSSISGIGINDVTISGNYIVFVGAGTDYDMIVYDMLNDTFSTLVVYTNTVSYSYDAGNILHAYPASYAAAWVGGPLVTYYLATTHVHDEGEYLQRPVGGIHSVEYFPDAFIFVSDNQVLISSLHDIISSDNTIKADVYYSTPKLDGLIYYGSEYYPESGSLVITGKITLLFNVQTGGHKEIFNKYGGDDDIVAVGRPSAGHYLYFPANKNYYYDSNGTMNIYEQNTTTGDSISIVYADNMFSVRNIYAAKLGSGWAVGHYDIKNYVKSGYYISDPVECTTDEQSDVKLDSVTMSWNADIPNGTAFSIFVSNNNGATWHNISAYNGIRFDNWTKSYDNNVFRYKVVMSSPEQIFTPFLNSIRYELETYAPVAAEVDPVEPHYTLVPVNFTARATGDIDGRIVWFNWSFGEPESQLIDGERAWYNGSVAESEGFNDDLAVSHIYARPGKYTVNLTLMDDDGQVSKSSLTVTILNRPPVPVTSLSVSSGTGYVGDGGASVKTGGTIDFSAYGSYDKDGDVTKYTWFVGGQELSGMNVSHTFDLAGVYSAWVRLWDSYGGSNDSQHFTIFVSDGDLVPQPKFSVPAVVQIGDSVLLDASPSQDDNGIVNYTWDINGELHYGQSLMYTFSDPGTVKITLTVMDTANQTNSCNHTVKVQYWPAYGDWVITSHVIVRNAESPSFHGNIIIKDGGWLEAENLKIVFADRYDGHYKIEVQAGGKLTAFNSEFDSLYFYDPHLDMTNYQRFHYNFLVSGKAYLNNTNVYALNGDKGQAVFGITISGGYLEVNGGLIERSQGAVSVSGINSGTVILNDCGIYHISQTSAVYITSPTAVITAEDIIVKSVSSFATIYGHTDISNSSFTYARNNGISLKGSGSFTDNIVKYGGAWGVEIASKDYKIDGNTVYGTGNNSYGYSVHSTATIYNSTVKWAWVGIFATADTSIVNTAGELNTQLLGAQGATITVKNFLSVKISYLGQPVKGATVQIWCDGKAIYDEITDSSGEIRNMIVPHGSTTQTEYEMTYYNTTASVFHESYEIYDINRTINMSTSHTEYWTYGTPPSTGGAVGISGQVGSIWAWVAIAALWALLLLAWYFRVLNLNLFSTIVLGILGTLLIAYFMLPDLFIWIAVGAVWAGIGLMWYLEAFTKRIKTYITAAAGAGTAAWAIWNGNASISSFSFTTGDYMPILASLAVMAVAAALYWFLGLGRGKEQQYFYGAAVIALAVYFWMTNPMIMYIVLMLAIIGGVAYYMIRSDAQISFGAAALILGLLAVAAIAIAYLMGIWYPGMFIMQSTETAAKEVAKDLKPSWWPF